MKFFGNILIISLSIALAVFFIYGSFVFGTTSTESTGVSGIRQIKTSVASISIDSKGTQSISYSPYQSGSTSSGFLSLDFGRLSTAFVMANPTPVISFSGSQEIYFQNLQGIISLYDPFVTYKLYRADIKYSISQITSGSFYISDEPDGTVSIYSIDAVVQLSFFDKGNIMTDMILFPGMYIRFDPESNVDLRGADLFRIMLVLGDEKNDKNTGLDFVNPRIDGGKGEDVFFMFKLPTPTRPLFQMLHLLFRDRIKQVNLIKDYASNSLLTGDTINSLIYNPNKKNYYLLDGLKSVLSRAVQSQMEPSDFRTRIEKIHAESQILVKGNSVQSTLESFLTDARFAIFGNVRNTQFNAIYTETASILGITPESGKGKFFQYLSDIYSRNIIQQRRDDTFSGVDTYSPTADGLERTLDNENIESKDYFDIALYSYQLLQKAQDQQMFTSESLGSNATYGLIKTLFGATNKYIQGLGNIDMQKSAYQTLVIQFYSPIANAISRSLYTNYTTTTDQKIYLGKQYLDGNEIRFDSKIRENLESSYALLKRSYENIAPLYTADEQQYTLISWRDSIIRIGAFIDMTAEGRYREYQKSPYIVKDIGGTLLPALNMDGSIEKYKNNPPALTPNPEIPAAEIINIPVVDETVSVK
ncbi:hypothetical protein H7169_03335 [Candidatus Gracilibacteria bacterium]|nr:hypothetical protein [Candidatus Gracilibacteria bacterium]